MEVMLWSALVLGGLGIVAALVLYIVARFFHVDEDERVAVIEGLLPGANCGACGRSGCHDFAQACVNATSLEGLCCPGAGAEVMARIADIVGLTAVSSDPQVAVIKCAGSCDKRAVVAGYSGVRRCSVVALTGAGPESCSYGCLGCGDCVDACPFGAMAMDRATGLPVVIEQKCVGCGKCVEACPRGLVEVRSRGRKNLRVWVACSNRSKGAVARKDCKVACIGCGLCVKACPFEAVTISDSLAHIDPAKCRLCRKCVAVCPSGAIHTANFPVPIKSLN